jgi:uncharacterized protein YecE (DUF72 family)
LSSPDSTLWAVAQLYLGTSGWAYPAWKGTFYPETMTPDDMLPFYARRFDTVEVNTSFYRLPRPGAIEKWRDTVPAEFRFAYKAFRGIVHRKRFADDTQILDRFAELLEHAGGSLGPVLFQFETIADVPQLDAFLRNATARFRQVAVEFRHVSWLTASAFQVLRERDVALCQTETDDGCDPLVPASHFAYLRLRKSDYSVDQLRAWRRTLQAMVAGGRDVYCYLKHEGRFAALASEVFQRC